MTQRDQSYTANPRLPEGRLHERVDNILDNAARINGEANYSREKMLRVWTEASRALVDELDIAKSDLADLLQKL